MDVPGIKQLTFYRHLVVTVVNDVSTSEESPKEQIFSEFCWSFFFNAVVINRQSYFISSMYKFYCFTARLNLPETVVRSWMFLLERLWISKHRDKIKRITESPAAFGFTHSLSIFHIFTLPQTHCKVVAWSLFERFRFMTGKWSS